MLGLTIASQAAALTTAYFTAAAGTAAQAGTDVLVANITAVHTVSFKNPNPIPIGGKINITFPGAATNPNYASPSATMFSFNGLATGNIKLNLSTGTATCTFTITLSANQIVCTTATAVIAANTTVTILIGCSSAGAATCATANQIPTIINPTKTAAAGTADSWTVTVQSTDSGGIEIDSAKTKIATIETVQVYATVDPTLSFSIAGVADATAINTGNTTGCLNTETTNTGIAATATVVNLGTLGATPSVTNTKIKNIAAQLLSVTTNAANGYTLTATASSHLLNFGTGFYIVDATTPAVFPSGTPWYGIHSCGLDTTNSTVGTTFWQSTASNTNCNTYITGSTGNICKYGWPTQTTSVTLAANPVGPIDNTITAGSGLTSVEYAAGVNSSVPPGIYQAQITYVATPTF